MYDWPHFLRHCESSSLNVLFSSNFEQIVVGGGTAGLAVATRLSQRLTTSCILVVEAGQDGRADPRIYQPGRKGSTMGTMYDWNLTTVPQPDASNRKFAMTRGKVLGGSSALNLMTWDRASRDDYDSWEILGNPGWDFKNMVAAMLKVEDFFPTPEYQGPGTGTSGIIQTLINRIYPKQQLPFIPVLNDFGVPTNLASLDGDPIGVMRQPSNIREDNYTRSYSPAYLEFAGRNLIIKLNTRVAKINIVDGLATGITLEDGSVIAARKEVILSAGSLLSPALLELSGVGQAAVLAAAGVPLLVDLPGVGENLQDHIRIQSSYQLKPAYEYAFDRLRYNTTYQAQQLALYDTLQPSEYDYTGSGYSYSNWAPTGAANVAKLLALAEQASDGSAIDKRKLAYLKDTSLNTKVPQLEVIFSDGYTGVKGYPANGTALYGAEFFALIASIQHPFSKGTVHISSANLSIAPTIDPNYLSKSYDLVAAATAAKFLRQLATSPLIAPT
jgi:choline dehydrogenase-like flavoprotein